MSMSHKPASSDENAGHRSGHMAETARQNVPESGKQQNRTAIATAQSRHNMSMSFSGTPSRPDMPSDAKRPRLVPPGDVGLHQPHDTRFKLFQPGLMDARHSSVPVGSPPRANTSNKNSAVPNTVRVHAPSGPFFQQHHIADGASFNAARAWSEPTGEPITKPTAVPKPSTGANSSIGDPRSLLNPYLSWAILQSQQTRNGTAPSGNLDKKASFQSTHALLESAIHHVAQICPTPSLTDVKPFSTGIRTPSEASSVEPAREECTVCRFPLYQSRTLDCKQCLRQFHETCKDKSSCSENKWKCARCIRKDLKKAKNTATSSASVPKPAIAQAGSTATSFGLALQTSPGSHESINRARNITLSNHNTNQSGSNAVQRISGKPERDTAAERPSSSTSSNSRLLRDAGIKPAGNAFAHGSHFRSDSDTLHSDGHPSMMPPTRLSYSGTEAEAPMDLTDIVDFKDARIIASTPMVKKASGAVDTPGSKEPTNSPSVQNANPVPKLTQTHVATNNNGKLQSLPPRISLAGNKVVNPPGQARNISQVKHKPCGMSGWSRAFDVAAVRNPFRYESGSKNRMLVNCDDIFDTFKQYPWTILKRERLPKRWTIELLSGVASLKNILDRFDSPDQCLMELEHHIDQFWRVRAEFFQYHADKGNLTSGILRTFIDIKNAQPLKRSDGPASTERTSSSRIAEPRPSAPVAQPVTISPVTSRCARKTASNWNATSSDSTPAVGNGNQPEQSTARKPQTSSARTQLQAAADNLKISGSAAGSHRVTLEQTLLDRCKTIDRSCHFIPNAQSKYITDVMDLMNTNFPPVSAEEDPSLASELVVEFLILQRHYRNFLSRPGSSSVIFEKVNGSFQERWMKWDEWKPKAHWWSRRAVAKAEKQHTRPLTAVSGQSDQIHSTARTVALSVKQSTTAAVPKPSQNPSFNNVSTSLLANPASSINKSHSDTSLSEAEKSTVKIDTGLNSSNNAAVVAEPVGEKEKSSHEEVSKTSSNAGPGNGLSNAQAVSTFKTTRSPVSRSGPTENTLPPTTLQSSPDGPQKSISRNRSTKAGFASNSTVVPNAAESQTPDQSNTSTPSKVGQMAQTSSAITSAAGEQKSTSGPIRIKLNMSGSSARAKNDNAGTPSLSSAGTQHSSRENSSQVTYFTLKEYLVLALYIEPMRLREKDATVQIPHLTSRSIFEFVEEMFPRYTRYGNGSQESNLYGSIASQCSYHCSRGLLEKKVLTNPQTQKFVMAYGINTGSVEFWTMPNRETLMRRWIEYLAFAHPHMLQEENESPNRKRAPVDRPIVETPLPKRQKRAASSTSTSQQDAQLPTPLLDGTAGRTNSVRAARKAMHSRKRITATLDASEPPWTPPSAMRMSVSNILNPATSSVESSPLAVAKASQTLPSAESSPTMGPEKDEPRPYVHDPIDDLVVSSMAPTAKDQELLDLIPQLCAQEAANDPALMARRNFEVKDFFEHWPEHHPSKVQLESASAKMEEIKKRPNRRQMRDVPYRPKDVVKVYRPYESLGNAAQVIPSEKHPQNTTSPSKQRSPQKRDVWRKTRAARDSSVIYADDITLTQIQPSTEEKKEKKVSCWQEALNMPRELVPGFVVDPTARGGKRLVLEEPVAQRGKSRTWFKAVLPDD